LANTRRNRYRAREKRFAICDGKRTKNYAQRRVCHYYDKFFTVDEVIFAEKGDLLLLGARTLEGLNLMIDSVERNSLRRVRFRRHKFYDLRYFIKTAKHD
jgi:hypothetical protein